MAQDTCRAGIMRRIYLKNRGRSFEAMKVRPLFSYGDTYLFKKVEGKGLSLKLNIKLTLKISIRQKFIHSSSHLQTPPLPKYFLC